MDGLVVNEARLGYDHVTAQEQATANMSLLGGTGNYLDPYYGNKCEMTMVSANSLQISTGAMWINGHNIQITSPITVPIANGQVGVKRKDLICVHLNTSNFGTVNAIDNFDIVAVQGTPSTGTPSDPTLAVDHITHDVQESWSVIGRVTLDGLTPKPELMLSTLPALLITPDRIEPNSIGKEQLEKTVWDSISLSAKLVPALYDDDNMQQTLYPGNGHRYTTRYYKNGQIEYMIDGVRQWVK
jgi:hypothetical protein